MKAITHLHSHGICHRDIKPDNVLVDSSYNLRLADFGFVGSQTAHSDGRFRTYLGTRGYMAPEIVNLREEQGDSYDGSKSDIFSCAVMLFVMVTGAMPFGEPTPADPHFKIIKLQKWDTYWTAIENSIQQTLSEDFKDLFQKMIDPSPELRPTAQEVSQSNWITGPCPPFEEIGPFMQANLTKVLEYEKKQQKDGRIRNEAYKRSLDDMDDPYGEDLDEEEIEQMEELEKVPEESLAFNQFRLVTKIHPLKFTEAVEEALKDYDDDFVFEPVDGEDFKFTLKVNVVE